MKTLSEVTCIEDFAAYINEKYPAYAHTEHEGIVYRNIARAYQIASRVRNYDDRKKLYELSDEELKKYLEKHYPHSLDNHQAVLRQILTDKICGCTELAKEYSSSDYGENEFGKILRELQPVLLTKIQIRYSKKLG